MVENVPKHGDVFDFLFSLWTSEIEILELNADQKTCGMKSGRLQRRSKMTSQKSIFFDHEAVVEIARTQLTGEEITQITYGSIIELDKVAGEPVNLVLDGKTIALGEVIQINNDKLGIRIVGIVQE